jgi:hypothetical protein
MRRKAAGGTRSNAAPLGQVPDNRTEAANTAPRALQNAPPDKIAPSPLNSPNVVAPDTKAETAAPVLKMDTGAQTASRDADTVNRRSPNVLKRNILGVLELSPSHPPDGRGRLLMTSEDFVRRAAECEYMAKSSRDAENKVVWRNMAERWVRCAELAKQQAAVIHNSPKTRQYRRISANLAY